MKWKLNLLTFICIFSITCLAQKDNKQGSKSIVPEKYLDAMNKADSVTFIIFDPWSDAEDNWMEGYGEVLNTKSYCDKTLQTAVYELLANPDSFKKSELIKNCMFMPDVAIVFKGKKTDVTIAYSFYCDVCRFAKEDKYEDFDGEIIRNKFIKLAAKGLPKDRYLRYLVKSINSK